MPLVWAPGHPQDLQTASWPARDVRRCPAAAQDVGPAYGEAFRDNGRVSIHDPAIAAALWHDTGLAGLLGSKLRMGGKRPLGCNPNIRFYRCQLLSPCSTAVVLQHSRPAVGSTHGVTDMEPPHRLQLHAL
ncbi:uncharacterized protein LOC107762755 [Haematococcus lacustris]|uniref:Uncharacterized protein LOC107762755 n=1 Tax=Haematococcus lacustris TaxID=44745 RepID=A0A699ZK19_HAELA|nr:uncharacterized protein LOC107762755 [Haematococcus lacustris]